MSHSYLKQVRYRSRALNTKEVSAEEILKSVNAWTTGHFLLSSGLHSDQYMQCQKVLQYPQHGLTLARALAAKIKAAGVTPQAVVGPALGAVHMEVFMAIALNEVFGKSAGGEAKELDASSQIRAIFAEREGGSNDFSIRRGVELAKDEKILVVEDVTTTGGSARKVVELVKSLGAAPVAVATIIDRSGGACNFNDFDIPFFSLVSLNLKTFQAEDCPMCKEGSKAVKPGSSKK